MTSREQSYGICKIVSRRSNRNRPFESYSEDKTLLFSSGVSNIRIDAIDEQVKAEANQKHQA